MVWVACRLTILRLRRAPSQGTVSCLRMSKGRKRKTRSTSSCCLQLIPTKSLHSRYPTTKWTDQTDSSPTGQSMFQQHCPWPNPATMAAMSSTCSATHIATHKPKKLQSEAFKFAEFLGNIVYLLLSGIKIAKYTHCSCLSSLSQRR